MTRLALLLAPALLLASCTTILRSARDIPLPPRTVVLTFDDGPYEREENDLLLLDVLKTLDVKAGFCLIGSKVAGHGNLLARMLDEGHEIAYHSWRHEDFLTKDPTTLLQEIRAFEALVQTESGRPYRVRFVRPPVGVLSLDLERKLLAAGYRILPSSHNPTDTFVNARDSGRYVAGLIDDFTRMGGGILVLHDGVELFPRPDLADFARQDSPADRAWVLEALPRLVGALRAAGLAVSGPEALR